MATTLLLFLLACMTEREAYIADYTEAVCAYREACREGGSAVGDEPCEVHYLAAMEEQACAEPDPEAVDACIALLEFYATECPEDVSASTYAACEAVCPLEE